MPSPTHHRLGTLVATALLLAIVSLAVQAWPQSQAELVGAIIRSRQVETPWTIISEEQILGGITAPQNTNVILHVPSSLERPIGRDILLGGKGKSVRYWGYCLPDDYDPKLVTTRQGTYPGKMYLSEREREVRAQEEAVRVRRRSPFNIVSILNEEGAQGAEAGRIRHEVDLFLPGALCFLMTEAPLAVGIDSDQDRLNDRAESDINTDPWNADTDGDGLIDGIEVQRQTDPLQRDTDGDGLIDGIEDVNFNGRVDPSESDPRNKDTDRDGLCDGLCLLRLTDGQVAEIGEDLNLSSTLDAGETSPVLRDTNGDGLNDYDAFFRCFFGELGICP
jgi:Bacterial TSP3 repeat